jgi:hypothetical protein
MNGHLNNGSTVKFHHLTNLSLEKAKYSFKNYNSRIKINTNEQALLEEN